MEFLKETARTQRRHGLILILLVILQSVCVAQKPDVLLITIDTLRSDRLGCYGYNLGQTPVIDQLATEGVRFTNVVSHVPLTRPSHTSIFTGLYPFQHGVHDNVAPTLDLKIPTLAEILRKNGYQTAGFIASFVVNSQSGLNRGFDVYKDSFDPKRQPTDFALNLEKRGDDVYNEFSDWYTQRKKQPYFAWVHLYDPHFPYEPPEPYLSKFAKRPYDGEIAYTDSVVGKILKLIQPGTLLIVTSDHGESLGEHSESGHSFFIYDTTLRVPLIIHWPGNVPAGKTVSMQARLIDLFPTILDLLSIPDTYKSSGISLKTWLQNPEKADPKLYSYAETYIPFLHFGWSRLLGVRYADWKYIQAPRSELYYVANDPGEQKNLISGDPERAKSLQQWLQTSGAMQQPKQTAPSAELDPETLEKLASLGYAGIAPGPASTENLADPKDKIQDFEQFNEVIRKGIEDFQNERYQSAASQFQLLEDKKIPSFEVHYYLGRSLLRLKSYDKASTELAAAIEKLPHFLPAYRDLAEAYEGLNQPKKAEEILQASLKVSPDNPIAAQSLGWLYQRQKRYDAAVTVLQNELKAHPDDLEARYRLGAVYRDSGRTEEAIDQFRQILAKNPNDADAHNQLGMLYGGANRLPEAIQEFTTAAKLAPGDEDVRHNLKLAQSRLASPASAPSIVRFRIIQTRTDAAAQTLLRKLKAGESWDSLAKNYSIHPTATAQNPILEVASPELDPAFRNALASLKPGETSTVISTPKGFFILQKQ